MNETTDAGKSDDSGTAGESGEQLLHLVFGGELVDLDDIRFDDLDHLDLVGIYRNYEEAYKAWKEKAQMTVDNAHMRYFIVHLHRLLDPEADAGKSPTT